MGVVPQTTHTIVLLSSVTTIPHVQALLPRSYPSVPTPPPKSLSLSSSLYKTRLKLQIHTQTTDELAPRKMEAIDAHKLRSHFLDVLRSRRSAEVPLTVKPGKPVLEPLYQESPKPLGSEAMESCPRENISNFKELLVEENFYLITEEGEQGRLPVLILSMKESNPQRRPAVVFLHSTNKCKEWLRPLLEAYASRGYIAISIDSRYHGERASSLTTYRDALVSSWKKGDTMPFIFDTVWDLIKLADYLTQREDIDPSKIGITGVSLGGMHAWFAAAADTRYTVVVPIIGIQGFRWAIDNDQWQARVNSIKAIFEEAQTELNKSAIDKEVVEKVWDRIAPGLASKFDAPYTLPIIAPRPLLVLNGINHFLHLDIDQLGKKILVVLLQVLKSPCKEYTRHMKMHTVQIISSL